MQIRYTIFSRSLCVRHLQTILPYSPYLHGIFTIYSNFTPHTRIYFCKAESFLLNWNLLFQFTGQISFSNQFYHGKFLFLFSSADIDNQASTSPCPFFDDFLIKPINYPELLLRIKQLLTHEEREDMLWYGNTLLHFSLGTLTTPKGTIDLTSYESKILHAFFEHPQCIISRAELLNINNAQNYDVSDRSIDVRISIIRKN